jgi:hypothetical protein
VRLSHRVRLARETAGEGVPALCNRAAAIDLAPHELADRDRVGRCYFEVNTYTLNSPNSRQLILRTKWELWSPWWRIKNHRVKSALVCSREGQEQDRGDREIARLRRNTQHQNFPKKTGGEG